MISKSNQLLAGGSTLLLPPRLYCGMQWWGAGWQHSSICPELWCGGGDGEKPKVRGCFHSSASLHSRCRILPLDCSGLGSARFRPCLCKLAGLVSVTFCLVCYGQLFSLSLKSDRAGLYNLLNKLTGEEVFVWTIQNQFDSFFFLLLLPSLLFNSYQTWYCKANEQQRKCFAVRCIFVHY